MGHKVEKCSKPRGIMNKEYMSVVGRCISKYYKVCFIHLFVIPGCVVVLCLVTQSCPTLCARKNCAPLRSPDDGIFQARILEWIAISFSKRLF